MKDDRITQADGAEPLRGLTPLELTEGERARRAVVEQLGRRTVLDADQLARMKDLRPRLEKEFHLPGDSRNRNKVWFFSVDGSLDGAYLRGCLFAGECITVQAKDFTAAFKLASDGLHDTLRFAREFYESQPKLVTVGPMEAGLSVDVGGGRAAQLASGQSMADHKLKAMIRHIIGGKTWEW